MDGDLPPALITAVPLDRMEAAGFSSCTSPSRGLATVHHAGGATPLKLPEGPTGLDQINVGQKKLPACVCV